MKSSPLRLNWVAYPEASYDTNDVDQPDMNVAVSVDVSARVKYNTEGAHYAYLNVQSREEDAQTPYKFSISAVASFIFDVNVARREYKTPEVQGLVPIIAVNVSRILYAGVREYLAMITSRATYGTVMLDSTLLEPADVDIETDVEPPDLIRAILNATDEEVETFRTKLIGKSVPNVGGGVALDQSDGAPKKIAKRVRRSAKAQ